MVTLSGGQVTRRAYGAVLALEAARLLPTKITKLALYEPAFIIDDSRPAAPKDKKFYLG